MFEQFIYSALKVSDGRLEYVMARIGSIFDVRGDKCMLLS